jgi:putative alpha-1,2-mannosidase
MIFIGNFFSKSLIFVISVAKPKNFVVFAFTYVSRSPALFNVDFCMNLYSFDSDEAMKRWSEAMKRLTVHRFNF